MAVIWLGTGRFTVPPPAVSDADAQAYLTAVEAADGQFLEVAVRDAINAFVVGCKADGIWTAIKASCILAGARTLDGCLVPLVGAAPTSYNFVAGDYNRETGLKGNGSTKYLDSNRNNNADPRNSKHLATYISELSTIDPSSYIAGRDSSTFVGSSQLTKTGSSSQALISVSNNGAGRTESLGFLGGVRSISSQISNRTGGGTTTANDTSAAPVNQTVKVFARNGTSSVDQYTNARLAFYSIGESLDLALLDARVSRLVNEIAFYLYTGLDSSIYDVDTLRYVNAGYAAGGSLS